MNALAWSLCIGLTALCGILYMVGTHNLENVRLASEREMANRSIEFTAYRESEDKALAEITRAFHQKAEENRELDQQIAEVQAELLAQKARQDALAQSEADLAEMYTIAEQIGRLQSEVDELQSRLRFQR